MAENTKIEWADHTFNPWTGCTAVSPACEHCYAEGWAKRSGHVQWGPHGERRRTSEANWRLPLKWDAQAKADGRRIGLTGFERISDPKPTPVRPAQAKKAAKRALVKARRKQKHGGTR